MKRIITAAIAAAAMAVPMTTSSASAERHNQNYHRGHDRGHDNWDDRRGERRAYHEGRRDQRRHDRWDSRRYNGYAYQGRWHYGPPPGWMRHEHVRYDYRPWRRGDRLSPYYRNHYAVVDYRRHHLRPPPRGYHYVRDDRGDYLLVGIATGVILGAILANN